MSITNEGPAIEINNTLSILEKRNYSVDESFPRITANSFKDEVIPYGIVEINYTVDLDSLPYHNW